MSKKPNKAKFFYQSVFFLILLLAVFLVMPQKTKENAPANTISADSATSPQTEETTVSQAGRKLKVAVMMYHHIGALPENADNIRKGLTVSTEEFEEEVKFLSEAGYTIVSFAELDYLTQKNKVPEKTVVLTFDDGYDDNYSYAFPVLKKYNAKGTFFIISGKIGKEGYITEDQIKEMSTGGQEIGSHSVNHPSLEKYKGQSLTSELVKSKETLEKITSGAIISFCYPAGKYTGDTIKAVQDAGYKYAVTTKSSTGEIDLDNPFEISRYRISTGRNIEVLLK